jgi:hypothetical protein
VHKKIEFIAQDDHTWEVRPRPYPAAKGLPKWWKDIPAYTNGSKKLTLDPYANVTVKRCSPTIDMLTSGYYIPLWADLLVEQVNNTPLVKWSTQRAVVGSWESSQLENFQILNGYSRFAFKNYHGWTIKTPPGWSCLFIHPVAYLNENFQTISGIVDTDVFSGEINVPFTIKDGFEGLIEKGTPMVQVIPFKRDNWSSDFKVKGPRQHEFDQEKLYSKAIKAYSSVFKSNKKYI